MPTGVAIPGRALLLLPPVKQLKQRILAVRRGNQYFFKNAVASGNADQETSFGKETDEVLIGDWNKDEVDTPAVRRGATFFVSDDFKGGNAAISFDLGNGSETAYAAKLK